MMSWYTSHLTLRIRQIYHRRTEMPVPKSGQYNRKTGKSDWISLYYIIVLRRNYFLINKDLPVISAGCSLPITSIKVGIMSARHPPSLNV